LVGRPVYSRKLAEWHFWLTLVGLSIFMVSLWLGGLVLGQQWLTGGIPFIESVRAMSPYFGWRLVGGILIGIGQLVFAYNVWRTVARGIPVQEAWAPMSARVSSQ
jgi:cbb3-type cytochrome oxidase subunit 1